MVWLHVLVGWGLAVGWSLWLAHRSALTAKMALVVALVPTLSAGVLSLVMFYLGIVGLPIRPIISASLYTLIMAVGWWRVWRDDVPLPVLSLNRAAWSALFLLFVMALAMIFNAVQWPFYRDDALGIYVPFAEQIIQTAALVPITTNNQLYELYPQLMSMNYAYVFGVAGWSNPYAARLINVMLSLAVLPTTYVLARQLFDDRWVAWFAVLVVAFTPDFGNWSHAGYVDLPMSTYYTLSAASTYSALKHQRGVDVMLAGLMIGLAAWTKNAALLGGAIFSTTLVIALILRQLNVKYLLLGFTWAAIAAGVWYGRNLLLAGTLTPDTVWMEDATQTLRQVFILITLPQNYGLSGWVMTLGVGWGVWQLFQSSKRGAVVFVLGWSIPYYLTWFFYASYDPRFILLFLPFWATLGGWGLATLARRYQPNKPMIVVVWTIAVILSMMVVWKSIEYKRAIIQQPFMSHEVKLDVVGNRD